MEEFMLERENPVMDTFVSVNRFPSHQCLLFVFNFSFMRCLCLFVTFDIFLLDDNLKSR